MSPHSELRPAPPQEIHLELLSSALTIAAFRDAESRLGRLAKAPYKELEKQPIRRVLKSRKPHSCFQRKVFSLNCRKSRAINEEHMINNGNAVTLEIYSEQEKESDKHLEDTGEVWRARPS